MKDLCTQNEKHMQIINKIKSKMFDERSITDICDLLKVISEPARLKIILSLNEGELCVNHIVEAVNGNQSAVSHQLRILKDNKVIKSRRQGQSIVYSLIDEHIMQIINLVKIHVEE